MVDNAKPATRECPFCRETIRAEAIKCRYCASSLLAATAEPAAAIDKDKDEEVQGKPGRITYIIDKDLIRFGKVAAAFLSLILVVGAALTGLDLKHAVSDANSAASDANAKLDSIKKLEAQVADSKKDLDAEQAALKREVAGMQQDIKEIKDTLPMAREIAATYHARTGPETTAPGRPGPEPGPQSANTSFTVPEVARLYNFPQELTGAGQNIAIIELGGGYRLADLQFFFASLKLPVPDVSTVSVDGGKNAPTNVNSADGQVDLDIEVAGTIAPRAHITVYFTQNSNQSFTKAIATAAHDASYPPSVLLIGWGGPEKSWTLPAIQQMNGALQDAASRGVTVVVAVGDNGATDGTNERAVDFPASSPWVLAVGGTRLTARPDKVLSETAWDERNGAAGATGGGVSSVFPQPDWQAKAHIPPFFGKTGRGVPDVAANADPNTGYIVRVDGQWATMGGTTAASPLWAGLIALLNQGLGRRLGYINPALYQTIGPSGAFNDITLGNNSVGSIEGCKAGPGWDYCSGWGSPNGTKLLAAFRNLKP